MTAATEAFPITVNHALTTEEMVRRGKYGWANQLITQEIFPHDTTQGTEKVELELTHFERPMNTDEILTEIYKQGYRSATVSELLALGEQHPEEQRKYFIAALGSIWESPLGNRLTAYLFVFILGRACNLRHIEMDWDTHWRFAVVRT